MFNNKLDSLQTILALFLSISVCLSLLTFDWLLLNFHTISAAVVFPAIVLACLGLKYNSFKKMAHIFSKACASRLGFRFLFLFFFCFFVFFAVNTIVADRSRYLPVGAHVLKANTNNHSLNITLSVLVCFLFVFRNNHYSKIVPICFLCFFFLFLFC